MIKEAINTFSLGMVKDLYPLTTPNSVLTNCLNGTIITYNGNEFVLQNDMGNGEVHTAYLDKGYVPVGMKEHGGIIYVASYNPITGKSLIGSFPSPQQLYEGDDLDITPIKFLFSNFIELKNNIPYIKLEYFKQKLFQVNNSDRVKTFHPGDKFIIVSNPLDAEIKAAINEGVIKLRLGVINSSGSIDYIDENNLKKYNNNLWIYETESDELSDLLRDNLYVLVFSAKSSGALILIIELKTFNTFNLLRKYSCDSENNIGVEFYGETTSDIQDFLGNTKDNANIGLIEDGSSLVQSSITKTGKSGTLSYKIMPVCTYGVLERLAKTGILDFDAIRTNSESLDEWRFYVTDTYIKIGWGYNYYNLNENSDIDRIDFTFLSLTQSDSTEDIESLNGVYTYSITKEYYNGSFEEVIPFSDSTILKDWIYIVRIDRYVNNEKTVIGYKLIYTNSYFNTYYEEIQDFDKGTNYNKEVVLKNGDERDRILLDLEQNVSADVKESEITFYIKNGNAQDWELKQSLSSSDYISYVEADSEVSTYRYNTRKVGKYSVKVKPILNYNYDKKYVGVPDQEVIKDLLGGSPTALFETPDNSNLSFSSSSILTSEIGEDLILDNNDIPSSNTLTYNSENREFEGVIYTSRNIIGNNGGIKPISGSVEKLVPLYLSDYGPDLYSKLFQFREDGDTLYCVTGSEDECVPNSKILISNSHTEGGSKGPGIGANADDDGMRLCLSNMGDGIIGMFGGHDKDHASLGYEKPAYTDGAWYKHTFHDKNEIDSEDNFILVTWKDLYGVPYIINLGSQKTASKNLSALFIRAEIMLKCFLSQMLVARKVSNTANIVGPNSSDFVYHNAFNTTCDIKITLNHSGEDLNVDFYLNGDNQSIETRMGKWISKIPTLKNYLPIFKIHCPSYLLSTIEYGDNLRFDNDSTILNCYSSAYSNYSNGTTVKLSDELKKTIYLGVKEGVNSDGTLQLAKNSDGTYKISSTSNKLYTWNPRSTSDTVNLRYNINDRFINEYAVKNLSGEVEDGFFNGVYIKDLTIVRGTWMKRKESSAPDMAFTIGFGEKSIFRYW